MYYVLDENGNRKEAYCKEEIMSVLQQAIDDGSLSGVDAQSAFVSKLKCCVGGGTFKQAFVTQAKYNELKANKQLEENTCYNITDDTTEHDIATNIEGLWEAVEDLAKAFVIDENGVLKCGNKIIPQKKIIFNTLTELSTNNTYVNVAIGGKNVASLKVTSNTGSIFYIETRPFGSNHNNSATEKYVEEFKFLTGLQETTLSVEFLMYGANMTGMSISSLPATLSKVELIEVYQIID